MGRQLTINGRLAQPNRPFTATTLRARTAEKSEHLRPLGDLLFAIVNTLRYSNLQTLFWDTHLSTYLCSEDRANRLVVWFQQDTARIVTISGLDMEGAERRVR